MRDARAAVPARGDRRDRALCQARLLLEVARRVAEPVEGFPPGSRPSVRLGLYRQAIYWVLVASRSGEADVPASLTAAWEGEDRDRLRRAAHDDITLESLKRTLVDQALPDPLDVPEEDAARARDFAQALLGDLDAPRRRIDRVVVQRWWRLSLVALVVVIAALGVRKLTLGPNLLADKPVRLSSSWPGCAQDAGCQALLFHTEHETNPWAEFDMGTPKTFKRLEVANRTDCCGDRAVPLVAEISNDRVNWREIGRKDTEFSTWTAKFPPKTARYLRLRVPRHSALHLKDVALR
jgi:NedA-like, galactose-binding domain